MLSQFRKLDNTSEVIYLADQGHAPYGPRKLGELADLAIEVVAWLQEQGADTIVVACNTASAAALQTLRSVFPGLAFVGMEPAIKPAALTTETRKVAVFATHATFGGRLFTDTRHRFASDVTVLEEACPEWVTLVESASLETTLAREVVARRLDPVLEQGVDRLVLACTHFSFLNPLIRRLSSAEIIDPSPAVALQVKRVATPRGSGTTSYFTTGDARIFTDQLRRLLDIDAFVGEATL